MKLRKLKIELELTIPATTPIKQFESKLYSVPGVRDMKIQTEDLGTLDRVKKNPSVSKLNMRKRIVRKALDSIPKIGRYELVGNTWDNEIEVDIVINKRGGSDIFYAVFNEPEVHLRYNPDNCKWDKLNIADPQFFDKLAAQIREIARL